MEGARLRSAPVLHRHRQQRDLGSRNGDTAGDHGCPQGRARQQRLLPWAGRPARGGGLPLPVGPPDHFRRARRGDEHAAVRDDARAAHRPRRRGDRAPRRAGDLALPVDGVAPPARLRPHRRHHPRQKRRELRGARLRGGEELPVDGRIWSVGDDAPVDQPLRRRPLPPQSGRADHPGRLVHARRPREHGSRAAVDHQRPLGVPLLPPQRGDAGGRRVLPRPRGDRRPPRRRRQDDGDHATKHVHGGEEVWERAEQEAVPAVEGDGGRYAQGARGAEGEGCARAADDVARLPARPSEGVPASDRVDAADECERDAAARHARRGRRLQ